MIELGVLIKGRQSPINPHKRGVNLMARTNTYATSRAEWRCDVTITTLYIGLRSE